MEANKNGRSHLPTSGFLRMTMDIPVEDHARFKAICALRQTTMRAEIQTLIAATIAEPDRLLSERLGLAGAPKPVDNGQHVLPQAAFRKKAG